MRGSVVFGRIAIIAAATLALLAGSSRAEQCLRPCRGKIACEREVTECLLREGRTPAALERLKEVVKSHPDEPAFAQLLARVYLADGNPFWAQRVLMEALQRSPRDCTTRAWLAWVHIGQGDLDLAREVLDREGCPVEPADRGRWMLLEAFMADAEQDPETGELVSRIHDAESLYAEDQRLWEQLRSQRQPGWIDPVHLQLETGLGYTSNAMAGSPTDPGVRGDGSLLGRMDLFGRLVWPAWRVARPALEAGLKGHGIGSEQARDLSYLEMSARPGLILGAGFPRVIVGYKLDYLVLNRETEAERRFYHGHRGEVEVETGSLTFFAGGGRRIFAENGRTRWEIDGGGGGSFVLFDRVNLLAAVSLRYYEAIGDPYDLAGGTALLVARTGLGLGLYARVGATLGLDHYFNSGGARGMAAYGSSDKRFDLLTKGSIELWSPSWLGARAGVSYEFSWRDSSVDRSNSTESYDYTEHRLLAKLRWVFSWNPWAPESVDPPEHVPLDYGLGPAGGPGMAEERIQDLLRQDEAARRGSSCVD